MFWAFKKQLLWSFLGFAASFLAFLYNYRNLKDLSYILHGIIVFLLLLTLLKGIYIKGARRWFSILGFRFQPSEFAKLSLILSLSTFFSALDDKPKILDILKSLPLVIVPFAIIVKQPDLGTALLFLAIYISYMVFSGISWKTLFVIFFALSCMIPVAWRFLKPYQKDRILTFLNPQRDPLGKGYHIIQSKIAIGSGGLTGKGLKGATQTGLGFIPEKHTDFAFSVFAEEWGFAGSFLLLLLYYILLYRFFRISIKARDSFGRYLAFGIFILFSLQFTINIFMCLGLLPVVGIPLPLISYGGSSILCSYISFGVALSIYSRRFMF